MEKNYKVKIKIITPDLIYFVIGIFFLYLLGCYILTIVLTFFKVSGRVFIDANGFYQPTGEASYELVEFYNIFNAPRLTYCALLRNYPFTTIFLSLVAVLAATWFFIKAKRQSGITEEREEEVAKDLSGAEFEKVRQEFTDLIIMDLPGKAKEEILWGIACFAKNKGLIDDEKVVYARFLEKENLGTTAISNGIALPEAHLIEMNRPFAFILCRTKEPVDFDSLDRKPVRVILASFVRSKDYLYGLKQMLYLARILKFEEYWNKFMDAETENDVYRLLQTIV
jgi:mannitol/fructose-specific phosphotransferase system IIA component (Ntr-type)